MPRLSTKQAHELSQFLNEFRTTALTGCNVPEVAKLAADKLGFPVSPNSVRHIAAVLAIDWDQPRAKRAAVIMDTEQAGTIAEALAQLAALRAEYNAQNLEIDRLQIVITENLAEIQRLKAAIRKPFFGFLKPKI
jgi:hypothetical protein